METITYIDSFDSVRRDGQKLAKISRDKMLSLKGKYGVFLKSTVPPVEEKKVEPVTQTVVQQTPPVEVKAPVTPSVEPPKAVLPAQGNNYGEVIDKFLMTVYDNSFAEKPLTGARKIRVNPKVTKHVLGLGTKYGVTKLEDSVAQVQETPIVEETINEPIEDNVINMPTVPHPVNTAPVVETSVATPIVNEDVVSRDASLPSVDDYLQKEVPSHENGLITQLTGDVEKLREETARRSELLEKMEAKYNELKQQRAIRIKELEEEKLSYTATLEGLTERIKNLQAAIEQEEKSLSGVKKAA